MRTIIYNANLYVENGVHATAICIENDRVLQVGTDAEILALEEQDTDKIDAKGRAVIPGFNDSHMHLYSLGVSLRSVQLYGSDSVAELIRRSRAFIQDNQVPAGTFVTGRGWNQDYFTDENRIPTRHDLDQISTDHPIVFNRACGHMAVCNTKALEVCGITKDTPQMEGAEFYYDEDGTPNGVFTEHAIKVMLESKYPTPTVEERTATINTAMDYALSHGITSVQTNDIAAANYQDMHSAYAGVYEASKARPRVYHQCFFTEASEYQEFLNAGFHTGFGDDYNKIGPLKSFVDGSLGARTALMRNAYADDASTKGIACMSQEQLNALIKVADDNNCQVAIHAIGDKAIEMVLDGYDSVLSGENPLRHGVVHCQITDEPLVDRFLENNVLAYVQPIFIHYDMHIVADRVGEELASTSYAFGDMLRKGIELSYGTDCPVEDLSTMDNLYCAVARKDLKAQPPTGYFPEQAVTMDQGIMLYSQAGAFVSGDESRKGRLLPGYLADLAILDTDIFDMDIEKLRDVKVDMTMVGGQVAYQR